MKQLAQLGMKKDWIYEVVISTVSNGLPHAAPFGMKSSDLSTISLDMYKGSKTLENILAQKQFVLNLLPDSIFFHQALFDQEKIRFKEAKTINAPVMADAPSHIEARVIATKQTKLRVLIDAKVVLVKPVQEIRLINRAKALFLESMVLSTRMDFIPGKKFQKAMKENFRVIQKVAPGSEYAIQMASLLKQYGILNSYKP